jgi:phosphoesterase RecJ-like protein
MNIKRVVNRYKLHRELKRVKSVAIVSHTSPDTDAFASSLLLKEILKYKYPRLNTIVLINDDELSAHTYIPLINEVKFVDDLNRYIQKYDLTIFCDHSEEHRFKKTTEPLQTRRQIAIDHHPTEGTEYALKIVDSDAPSATQVLVELFPDNRLYRDTVLSELALLGILGDSGNLRFQNSNRTNTYSIVEKLIRLSGLNQADIMDSLFSHTKDGVKMYAALYGNMQFFKATEEFGVGATYLPREFRQNNLIANERAKAAENFKRFRLATTKDYPLGFTVSARDGYFSISARCLRIVSPAAKLLAEAFNGGGHPQSGGGKLDMDPATTTEEEAMKIVAEKAVEILKQLKTED